MKYRSPLGKKYESRASFGPVKRRSPVESGEVDDLKRTLRRLDDSRNGEGFAVRLTAEDFVQIHGGQMIVLWGSVVARVLQRSGMPISVECATN